MNCFKRLHAFHWNGFVCPLYYLEWWVLYCSCIGRLSLCLRLVSVRRQRSHLVPENGVRLPYSLGTSVNTSIFFKYLRQNWGGDPWVHSRGHLNERRLSAHTRFLLVPRQSKTFHIHDSQPCFTYVKMESYKATWRNYVHSYLAGTWGVNTTSAWVPCVNSPLGVNKALMRVRRELW